MICSYKPVKLLHSVVFWDSSGDEMTTFVLEPADCHVNSTPPPPLCAKVMIRGPEFLVGTKCHYLSMQESQHDIPWPLWQRQTYANVGECHSHYDPCQGEFDTSLWTPNMFVGEGAPIMTERWQENRCSSALSLLVTPFVFASLSPASVGLFASSFLFFCLHFALKGETGLQGGNSLK